MISRFGPLSRMASVSNFRYGILLGKSDFALSQRVLVWQFLVRKMDFWLFVALVKLAGMISTAQGGDRNKQTIISMFLE